MSLAGVKLAGQNFVSQLFHDRVENYKAEIKMIFSIRHGPQQFLVDKIDFDLPGLVVFRFPFAALRDWLVTTVALQAIKVIIQPSAYEKLKEMGHYSSAVAGIFAG